MDNDKLQTFTPGCKQGVNSLMQTSYFYLDLKYCKRKIEEMIFERLLNLRLIHNSGNRMKSYLSIYYKMFAGG